MLKDKLTPRAKLDDRLPEVVKFAEELKKKYKTVSILGYCWGKSSLVGLLNCQADNRW